MRVTFDTNTLKSAVRPERHSKDPRSADFYKVHDALKAGILKGYFSETIVTLEGIEEEGSQRRHGRHTRQYADDPQIR